MNTLKRLFLAVVYSVAVLAVPAGIAHADEAPAPVDSEMQEALDQLDALLATSRGENTATPDAFSELNGLQAKFQRLQGDLSRREQELKAAAEALADAETRVAALETQIQEKSEPAVSTTEMEARLKNLQDENQILKDELEHQHRRVEKAVAEQRQAEADFARLFKDDAKTGETDTLNARHAADIEQLKGELEAAQADAATLHKALEDEKARKPEPVAAVAGADAARLRELEAAVEDMRDVDAQRKAAMDDLFKQLAAQKKEMDSRDQMLAETRAALDAEKGRVAERDRELADRDAKVAAQQETLTARQKELETQAGTLADVRRTAEQAAAAVAAREADLLAMRGDLEQVKLVDAQRRKTLDETLASLATAEQRVKTLGGELEQTRTALTASAEETAARLAVLTARNALLEGEISRMELDVKAAETERDAALAKAGELKNTLAASDANMVDLEAQVARLSAVDTQRRKAMDQILLDTATLEQEKSKLELEMQRLTLAAAERKTEDKAAPDAALVMQVQNENTALRSRIAELETALQAAREVPPADTAAPAVVTAVPPAVSDAGAAALAQLEQTGWQQDRQRLEGQLRELRDTAARDAERMETMTRELTQAQQSTVELTARVKELEGRKSDVRDSDLFKELEQINAMLREKMLEVEADRQRLARLGDEAAKTQATQAKTIETHTARLAAMDSALTEAQAREDEYKELIERLVPQVETLEQQVTALVQARLELTNRLLQRDEDLQALKVELERREHRLAKAERVADVLEKARAEVLRAGDREKLNMHYNMASVYARDSKFAEAENEYLQALRIDPTDADVHYNLGILYDDEMKQREKAMVHYRRYLQLSPHGPDADRVRTWLMKLEMQTQR